MILLKFYGHKDGERKLFDAFVVDAQEGASFPIREGYDFIEVYAEPIDETPR